MASNKGLGKGLGALLGDFEEVSQEKSAYQSLPIYKVNPIRISPAGTSTKKNSRHWPIPSRNTASSSR